MCIVCGKTFFRGQRPKCKVALMQTQHKIVEKATQLNETDILLRISGEGHDMVANDICYHKTCMDRFKTRRVARGKSTSQRIHDSCNQLGNI